MPVLPLLGLKEVVVLLRMVSAGAVDGVLGLTCLENIWSKLHLLILMAKPVSS